MNIASVEAFKSSAEGLAHYTIAKHAIGGLTRSLAMELGASNIRVNAVCPPGAAMTEGAIDLITAGTHEGIDVAAQWGGIVERAPLRRLCSKSRPLFSVGYVFFYDQRFPCGGWRNASPGIRELGISFRGERASHFV